MSFATELLIGSERIAGDGSPIQVENPFSERTIAALAGASAEQVSAAVAAATEAARGWASTPALERGEMLHEVATRLRARSNELAHVMTLEGGKPLVENSDEIGWTAAAFAGDGHQGAGGRGRLHRARR